MMNFDTYAVVDNYPTMRRRTYTAARVLKRINIRHPEILSNDTLQRVNDLNKIINKFLEKHKIRGNKNFHFFYAVSDNNIDFMEKEIASYINNFKRVLDYSQGSFIFIPIFDIIDETMDVSKNFEKIIGFSNFYIKEYNDRKYLVGLYRNTSFHMGNFALALPFQDLKQIKHIVLKSQKIDQLFRGEKEHLNNLMNRMDNLSILYNKMFEFDKILDEKKLYEYILLSHFVNSSEKESFKTYAESVFMSDRSKSVLHDTKVFDDDFFFHYGDFYHQKHLNKAILYKFSKFIDITSSWNRQMFGDFIKFFINYSASFSNMITNIDDMMYVYSLKDTDEMKDLKAKYSGSIMSDFVSKLFEQSFKNNDCGLSDKEKLRIQSKFKNMLADFMRRNFYSNFDDGYVCEEQYGVDFLIAKQYFSELKNFSAIDLFALMMAFKTPEIFVRQGDIHSMVRIIRQAQDKFDDKYLIFKVIVDTVKYRHSTVPSFSEWCKAIDELEESFFVEISDSLLCDMIIDAKNTDKTKKNVKTLTNFRFDYMD